MSTALQDFRNANKNHTITPEMYQTESDRLTKQIMVDKPYLFGWLTKSVKSTPLEQAYIKKQQAPVAAPSPTAQPQAAAVRPAPSPAQQPGAAQPPSNRLAIPKPREDALRAAFRRLPTPILNPTDDQLRAAYAAGLKGGQ